MRLFRTRNLARATRQQQARRGSSALTLRNRPKATSLIAGISVPAVLATLALINPGVTISEVELNDGAVWVTNSKDLKVGRYNAKVKELNGGVVTKVNSFDVLQDKEDIFALEPSTLSRVDPATMAYTQTAQIPAKAAVAMHANTLAVADVEGRVWVMDGDVLDTFTQDTPPTLDLSDGTVVSVSRSGTAYAFDPGTGLIHTLHNKDGVITQEAEPYPLKDAQGLSLSDNPAGLPVLTTLGETPVLVANDTLYTQDVSVPLNEYGNQAVVQTTGQSRGEVLVATDRSLLAVNIESGKTTRLVEGANGRPTRPVWNAGCAYAAWSSSTNNYAQLCGRDGTSDNQNPDQPQTLEDVSELSMLKFRVNRKIIMLNDTAAGRVWLPEQVPQSEEPNWKDIKAPHEEKSEPEESENQNPAQQDTTQCVESDRAPRAKKDHFGVRAGRTTPLDVLNNDSAGQCGIIAITENTSVPESFGQVQLINNGRGLQIDVARGATGTAEFTYTITDGRGKNPPSTTTVTIEVSDQESNQAPVELRKSRAEIEQGATLSHNALANFRDPDGDPLVLESARVEQGQGTVRFRKDGMLTYIADSTDTGPKKVALVVSDGTDSIPATLTVDVRAAGTLAPTVNPIHRVAHVSSPVEIDVLSAVKNRSTEPVRLAAVDEVAGTSIAPDLDSGTFTFSAPTPGSYYVNLTLVSSPHTVTALARIDVREWPEEPLGPVAVSDVALLPAGGEVTVAPLANDFDPNGGVMVLTGIELEEDSRLSVGVIEHRYVKIESGISIDKPEVIHYFVDNGYATSRGTILVTPVEPSVDQRAPEIKPIDVTVRAGGVVTIPVLDYVSDADGDTVKLSQELPEPLPADQGLLFVSGDVLRYQAPDTTGTTQTHFVVEDSAGNTAVGTLNVSIHESTPETKAPPTPKRITARAYAGETIRIYTPLTGIDVDGDGVTLLGQGDVLPSQGYVSAVGADWIEYTASLTGKGTDTFTYAVEDWTGQRALGTVRVGIVEKPRDALPIVASDDEVTVQPGTTVEVRVTRNDVDPSGLDLTVDPIIGVTQADVEVNEKRVVVKVPEDASGTISIPYTVRNTVGGTATAVLRVRVSDEAVISQPVAKDIVVAPHEVADKISAEVDVLAVAENPSGPLSDLDISIPASHAGNASVTGERKVLVTLGKTAQTIPFKLTNKKSDGKAYTYAFISVPALGDFPPVLRPKARALKVASGGELLIPLTEFVQVGPGKTPHILDASSVKAQHSDGSSLVVDEETLQFTSKRGYEGTAAISFEVWDTPDETGKSSILTIPITVFPEDGFQPTFSPTVIQVPQGDEPVSVDLGEFTKAPSGTADESYGYRLSSAPTSGFTTSISGSILTVQAPASLPRGTKGNVSLTVSYGLAGTLAVTVPFEVVASTKALPIVNDHVVVASAGKATTLNALQGAVDPVGKGLRVVRARNLTESVGGLTSTDGKNITIVPPEDFSGTMKIAYVVTDALNDVNRNVEGVVEVTVRKEPDAPSAPRVSNPTNRTVTVAWDAPNSNGTPVLDYRVTAQPGGKSITCVTTTCEFSGLNNGTPYRFTVAARNAVGHSPESALSAEIVPDVLPLAPERPTVEGGDQRIEASWTQPQNDGSPITSYIVEVSPGLNGEGTTTKSVTSTSTTLTGAKNGTAYMVRVRAVNSANTGNGAGPWSAYSESVIPAGPPAAPTVSAKLPSDTPLGRQIQVSWNSNGANGDPITGYSLVVLDGNTEVTSKKFDASTTSWTFSDAQNGVDYKFAVRARNRAGQSEPGISETISSFTAPSAPQANATSVVPSRSYAQGGALALGWGVPTDTGGKGLAIAYYEIKDVAAKVSGTSYIVENLPVGQPTGGYDVRACNERGACSGWTRLNGGTPVTKPQAPTLSVSAPTYSGTYNITVTPRNEGGLTATHQYRIDGGAWKDVKGTIPPFSVNDFGDADSKDVRVEARSMNEQGSSPIVENVVTVTKPQLPGAPQNISSSQDPDGDTGDVLIEWQKAKEQGIAIQRYGYCLEAAGTDISCKHTGNGLNGETTRGPNDLKAAISDLENGSGHTLKVWAITADGNGKVATFVFSFPYYSGGG